MVACGLRCCDDLRIIRGLSSHHFGSDSVPLWPEVARVLDRPASGARGPDRLAALYAALYRRSARRRFCGVHAELWAPGIDSKAEERGGADRALGLAGLPHPVAAGTACPALWTRGCVRR